jgi:hypothetical protein
MKLYIFLPITLFFSFAIASYAADEFKILSAKELANALDKTENKSIENNFKTIKISLNNNNILIKFTLRNSVYSAVINSSIKNVFRLNLKKLNNSSLLNSSHNYFYTSFAVFYNDKKDIFELRFINEHLTCLGIDLDTKVKLYKSNNLPEKTIKKTR